MWLGGLFFFFNLLLCVCLIHTKKKCLANSISHFNEDFNDLHVCDVEKLLDTYLDAFVNSFCIKMLELILSHTGLFSGFLLLQVLLISSFNKFFNLD